MESECHCKKCINQTKIGETYKSNELLQFWQILIYFFEGQCYSFELLELVSDFDTYSWAYRSQYHTHIRFHTR